MRLNIIGNGFDLYHGLPSKCYHFGCYLATHHLDFYQEMSEMYAFPCSVSRGHTDFDIIVSDPFWKYFEEHLGMLNPSWMEHRLIDDPGLESDDPIDLDIPECANSQILQDKFFDWISTTVNTHRNFDIVKKRISKHKCHFRPDDFFVTFNYTQTLEQVYSIPSENIIHIHGKCHMGHKWNDLIVGHGNDEAIKEARRKIAQVKEDPHYRFSQSSRNRIQEYECELSILEDLKKDVPFLSARLISMLRARELDVDTIRVWAFSCGTVDEPYIHELHKMYPDAQWQFSFFGNGERLDRIALAQKIGLKNVSYFQFANPDSASICAELVKENRITEYPVDE